MALMEDMKLCGEIVQMRYFVRILEKSRERPKDMTVDEWGFLEEIDQALNSTSG